MEFKVINIFNMENKIIDLFKNVLQINNIGFIKEFYNNKDHILYQIINKDKDIGLIGIIIFTDKIIIKHIAIEENMQRQNKGREAILKLQYKYSNFDLEVETDDEAISFYKNLGFDIYYLGELYPNTNRYKCILKSNKLHD